MTILFDFESRSEADLEAIGGRNYWVHPTTEALCCVLHDTDSGAWAVWEPGDPAPWDASDTVAAHNYDTFDRFGAERYRWPTPRVAIDSSVLARRAGLPGALDALAQRWLGREKDTAGKKTTMALSGSPVCGDKVDKNGELKRGVPAELREELRAYNRERKASGCWPTVPAATAARVREYCRDDVGVMAEAWPRLEPWNELDADMYEVDRAMNERGVGFDSQLARRLVEECDHNADEALEALAVQLRITVAELHAIANSPKQFAERTGLPNAQAETIALWLHDTGEVGDFCRARSAIASIARGKLEAGLARVSPDGRLRDSLRYYGAHPGRWSHTGMQLGNMPRPDDAFKRWTDADICRRIDEVLAGGRCTQAEIDLLLRACLHAREGHVFVVYDFAGVEARALAWSAGDWEALKVLLSPLSPYKVAAGRIFGCDPHTLEKSDPRYTAGKIAELALQYQGGVNALVNMGLNFGIDLRRGAIPPQAIVDGYRTLHAPIKRFWYAMQDAAIKATDGYSSRVGPFEWTTNGEGDVACLMPSGRPIVYNAMHTIPGKYGPQLRYMGTKSGWEFAYGGSLTQNAMEGICRDELARALVAQERAGFAPVLSVHDETVDEVPANAAKEAREEIESIMTTPSACVQSFPLGAEGFVGTRYRK